LKKNSKNQQLALPFFQTDLSGKKTEISYSGNQISTDGGLLQLREMNEKLCSCFEYFKPDCFNCSIGKWCTLQGCLLQCMNEHVCC